MMNESIKTTASFPVKKIAYRNSIAAAQAAAGEQRSDNNNSSSNAVHRTSGSINASSTPIGSKECTVDGTERSTVPSITASQHEAHQRQRQRELANKKAEVRKVALETARFCSTGVITTFSDFSDGKNTNTNRNNNSARNNKTKPKSSPKRMPKKKAAPKIVKRTTPSGVTTYHEILEDDDENGSNISQTTNGGSHTITTTATTEGDNNALPSINEEGGGSTLQNKRGGKKFTPKRMLAPLLKNERDHSTSLTAYQKYQEQLAQEAQGLLSTGDVWMCSVCGTPFDSLENADSHELHCVVHWIRCDLFPSFTGNTKQTSSSSLREDSNGQQPQRRTRRVSFESMDGESESEDEPKRQFYMSARSRFASQQRSNKFRSYRSSQMPTTTGAKDISALTVKNSSIMSRLISFDSTEVPSPPPVLSVTPSIHLPRMRSLLQEGRDVVDSLLLHEPPSTGGEITLPSQDLQQYIMITDKMAVTIAHRTWKVLEGLCHRQLFNSCLDRNV